jgi:hypothetical protein
MAKPKTESAKRKKVAKVMHEFKEHKLKIGKSKKRVKKRKQAIAIALSEAGKSRRQKRCEFFGTKKCTCKLTKPNRKHNAAKEAGFTS